MRPGPHPLRTLGARVLRDRRGVAAVEFAILAPLFLLVLGATAGIGLGVVSKIRANEAVSAAAHGALIAGDSLKAGTADQTAADLATILRRAWTVPDEAVVRIEFNGARTYRFAGREAVAAGATAAVDECRCPTRADGAVQWGDAVGCGQPCSDAGIASRYVLIDVAVPASPVFASFVPTIGSALHVQTLVPIP